MRADTLSRFPSFSLRWLHSCVRWLHSCGVCLDVEASNGCGNRSTGNRSRCLLSLLLPILSHLDPASLPHTAHSSKRQQAHTKHHQQHQQAWRPLPERARRHRQPWQRESLGLLLLTPPPPLLLLLLLPLPVPPLPPFPKSLPLHPPLPPLFLPSSLLPRLLSLIPPTRATGPVALVDASL